MKPLAWGVAILSTVAFGQSPERFDRYAVASDSAIASRVGAEVMKDGGNAIDAAVAVGFALAVVHPAAGNIGGGGFMVYRTAAGKSYSLDFREVAPARATADMYRSRPEESLVGYKAAGVPGTVAGLFEAHRKFGKLPWKRLVDPAVKLAGDGFTLPPGLADSLKHEAADFKPFAASYAQFARNGKPYKAGETWKQPDLAKTLARIRDQGAKSFYERETARLIAACGTIELDDLKRYKPVWRDPIIGQYKGLEIITMPPPSSGGIALVEMVNILRNDDLKALGYGSSDHLHLIVEAMKRAFADRSEHVADPDFAPVPVAKLLAIDYADLLRKSIGEQATKSADIHPSKLGSPRAESEETTHYSVVDADGAAVSITYTLNGSFGSHATVPGAGFLLNNEMDDFTTQPGKPNMFGLIQGEKNKVEPGKRPLSSMTPTIVANDGKLKLVLGSPGGPTIINTVFQTILNIFEFGMNVQRAVTSPRIHHQWLPDQIRWESFGVPKDVKKAMEARGHVFESSPRAFGSCHAIEVVNGERQAGVDPRISTSGAAGG